MLFIVFDIETVFLIPWAVAFRSLPESAGLLMIEMFAFMLVLGAGYLYIWKRGALQWD
jgi:NADH-quinone oxidoreductase subunit A